jgi:hypothetical protein
MKSKYDYWKPDDDCGEVIYRFESTSDCFLDSLDEEGFKKNINYISPYFFIDECSFIEVISYFREDGTSIVFLTNYNQELYSYYCRNKRENMECVKYLLEIANNITQIEYHRFLMQVKSDEEFEKCNK